jgi:hypothetical protein
MAGILLAANLKTMITMKKTYQKLMMITVLVSFTITNYAADLCVAENGAGGCYSSISDAINAASNGDRIIIAPKAGGSAYAENLSISKSLQLLCNTEGGQWAMQGNITITPAVGRNITFIGMKNMLGNITSTGNSPSGTRTRVNILNSEIVSGNIDFVYDNFDASIISTVLSDGYVGIKYGKVIGCDISSQNKYYTYGSSLYVGEDATPTNDTILIIGNKIKTFVNYGYGIFNLTQNQYVYIANNYIKQEVASYYTYAIGLSYGNTIRKNTTVSMSGITGIYLSAVNSNAYFDIYNNLTLGTSGYGVYLGSGTGPVSYSYNFMSNPLTIYNITDNGTNNTSSNTVLDVDGKPMSGSDAINGGSPDEAYYDLNLTKNDVGAYGGSFTLDNYFPITGAARVYHVQAPRKITLGSTLDVKAFSFDR